MARSRELEELAAQYDEAYYRHYSAGGPYLPGEPGWEHFFSYIAETIVAELSPRTVLDAGCGVGILVGALRRLGVDAKGLDISEFAISQVPEELREHCRVASVTDDLGGRFDLIVCIEVLEHIGDAAAQEAVANLCSHTDSVLFSSTPDDFTDPTHRNVQPTEYWAEVFARWGLFRNVDLDTGFLAPQAIHFLRAGQTPVGLARAYERWHWRTAGELGQLRAAKTKFGMRESEIKSLESREREAAQLAQRLRSDLDSTMAQLDRSAGEIERVSALADAREDLRHAALRRAERAEEQLDAVMRSRTMRYTRLARGAYGRARRRARPRGEG